MAKQCPKCQQLLDEAVRYCPICGTEVSQERPVDGPIEIPENQLSPLIPETFPPPPVGPSPVPGPVPPPILTPNLKRPVLLAGVVLAVLSALPVVSCCCLIWVVGSGVLAVYLLRNEFSGEINAGLGARLGFFTALVGASLWQLLDVPLSLIDSRGEGLRRVEEMIRSTDNLPAESLQIFDRLISLFSNPLNPLVIIIGLVGKLLLCGVLTTLGGVLGVAFFGKPRPSRIDRP